MVKSAHSVESPKKATKPSQNPKANSAKSAESPANAINSWEWITERAAFFQFQAGMDRDDADARAFMCWYHQFVEADSQ